MLGALCVLGLAGALSSFCADDLDCSLNGKCNTGRCTCSPSWVGNFCNRLNLLPATKQSGLRSVDGGKNTSSWGGQVLRGDDGKWHMYAAEMINHCGINAWTRNSRIIHAVSDKPGGMFVRADVVQAVFAHEPTVTRSPQGKWAMWYTSFLHGGSTKAQPPCACADGSTDTQQCSNGEMSKDPSFMIIADHPEGPWSEPQLVPLADCNRSYCQHDMNLAGLIFANDSLLGMVKVHAPWGGGSPDWSEIHLVQAVNWSDATSYVQAPNDESGNLFPELVNNKEHPNWGLEDPELWQDEDGHYHALFHSETGLDSGAHACSYDGKQWKFTGVAFNTTVRFTDGSTTVFTRRERPHVIFGDISRPHTPTHLSNGVQYGMEHGDATYTLIQPIAV